MEWIDVNDKRPKHLEKVIIIEFYGLHYIKKISTYNLISDRFENQSYFGVRFWIPINV